MQTMEMEKLREAFQLFSTASEQLSRYYQKLEQKVQELTQELHEKNTLLEAVITCMGEPLIVLGSDNVVRMYNARAAQLLAPALQLGVSFDSLGIRFGRELNISGGWYIPERFEIDEHQGWVVLLKDITLVKQMEQERQRMQRLEAMGQTLATVVHELRNPLCSIELYATMLLQELQGTSHEALAKGISEGVRNLDSFLSNALYFARPRKPKLQEIVLREVLDEVLNMLSPMLQERMIKVRGSLSEKTLKADRALIKQVFLNILMNAIQAIDRDGCIEFADELQHGEYLVKIRDSGPGVPEEYIERVFDPFFTTKPEGTGLGLSISLKIMQAHGGGIRIKSRPGQGTEFVLYFPE